MIKRHKYDNNRNTPQNDDYRTAQQLLSDQLLILGLIHNKLEVLKYISDGHTNNKPVLSDNAFIQYMAQVFYRSLVIDFTALFGKDGINDGNSLQQLYNKKFDRDLPAEKLSEIRAILGSYKPDKNPIKRLTNYRNKEVAHYDITASNDGLHRITAKFNWEFIDTMIELYGIAEKVIGIGMDAPVAPFSDSIQNTAAFEKMINDLAKVKG